MNNLHHKLSYRLHRALPKFGIVGIQKVPAPGMPGKFLFVRAEDGGVAHQLLVYREYEPFESRLVREHIEAGMTVYNIGGNIGYYALLCSACVGALGKVLAFEPEPGNFELLQRNIGENGVQNIELFPMAIGSALGTASLSISASNSGDHQLRDVRGREAISVPVTTLDRLIAEGSIEPNAIVMDVQGSELDVIMGAKDLLSAKSLRMIFFEFWPQGLNDRHPNGARTLLETLGRAGFRFQLIDENRSALSEISVAELLETVRNNSEVNVLASR
jgi:FkbM family methyltransferase